MKFTNSPRGLRFFVIWLAAYVGSYALLSSEGRFIFANHGGLDWTYRWGPAHLVEEYWIIRSHERLTMLGIPYWPCIVVDRLVWHRPSEESTPVEAR